jgi:hypothetical protein
MLALEPSHRGLQGDQMNQLVIASDECCCCGQAYWPGDQFCSACGALLLPVAAAPARRELAIPPGSINSTTAKTSAMSVVLNSRGAVWCALLVAGPLGLPLLWLSPRFSSWSKIATTVLFFVVTVLLPIVVAYYFLDIAVQPLLGAFKNGEG